MRTLRLATSFLILGLILVAVPAMADPTPVPMGNQVMTIGGSGYGPYQTGLGGEFTLQVSDDLSWILNGYKAGTTMNVNGIADTFQTFCLEYNEHIYPNTIFNVEISDSAKNGGVGGATNGADPISTGTAWLYSQFATGNLDGYAYNTGGTSAANLQNAIWMLEGEIVYDANNPFIQPMLTALKLTDFTDAQVNADGAYGIAVLNMYSLSDGLRQDQLVMVPEPASMLLLGISLICIAIAVRRFHKGQA